ncbi:hypothetical protein MKW98_031733 [Papaver atlanticum]|uniref:Uncharacterized protein n=1 Tax=Papaver atlanticum TaxID=357466 RepID=A0AAD4X889_9MAGN|nr:hypothetical protein MKW98_031733 [Papaver atlanticum]
MVTVSQMTFGYDSVLGRKLLGVVPAGVSLVPDGNGGCQVYGRASYEYVVADGLVTAKLGGETVTDLKNGKAVDLDINTSIEVARVP